jgi:hypothetical protein
MKYLIIPMLSTMFAISTPLLASETVEGVKKDYEAAKIEVAAQLESLDKKIDELKASAQQKSTTAKEKTLKEAQTTREKLSADYERMKADSGSNWKSFKKRVARSLKKLNAKAQKALNE